MNRRGRPDFAEKSSPQILRFQEENANFAYNEIGTFGHKNINDAPWRYARLTATPGSKYGIPSMATPGT